MKFTKIVATVSGNSGDDTLIADLWKRGMDVVRLNTAHISVEELKNVVQKVRKVSPYLAVMIDTKGPNIRTCNMEREMEVKKGDFLFFSGKEGKGHIQVNYPPFADEVPVGSRLVCDDGAAAFLVTEKKKGILKAKALFDCIMRNKKSINVPDVSLNAPALSGKDREFLKVAVEIGADFIAHSFVRSAADVEEVRKALGKKGKDIAIIAKIENREGVKNLKSILDAADGVMVARGDLGIEIPLEEVPAIQKQIIHTAMEKGKPVITATQMLQSMEESPAPTRAEVSDVANAVYDGTDAVMLSGETAHGKYPREAVDMMRRIVEKAEKAPRLFFTRLKEVPDQQLTSAFMLSTAVKAAQELPVKAILCSSLRGVSAKICSAMRPKVPILTATPSEKVMRQLALNYGVFPILTDYTETPLKQLYQTLIAVRENKIPLKGKDLVVVLSKHYSGAARNNLCCITTMEELQ